MNIYYIEEAPARPMEDDMAIECIGNVVYLYKCDTPGELRLYAGMPLDVFEDICEYAGVSFNLNKKEK